MTEGTHHQDMRHEIAATLELAAKRIREHGTKGFEYYFTNPGDTYDVGYASTGPVRVCFDQFVESGGDDGWPEDADAAAWGILVNIQSVTTEETEADDNCEFDYLMTLHPVDEWADAPTHSIPPFFKVGDQVILRDNPARENYAMEVMRVDMMRTGEAKCPTRYQVAWHPLCEEPKLAWFAEELLTRFYVEGLPDD